MKRFKVLRSLAGELQPGDGTKYELVAVKTFLTVEVIVMNESFFDKITFVDGKDECYTTHQGLDKTNPWTIKAASEIRDMLMKEDHNVSSC